jgi:branched-chain amino acid aminotransferase
MVRRGGLVTTPRSAILEGITRDTVLTIAADHGIAAREEFFTRDQLYVAEEAFFTGTAAEITPIREVDRRAIGAGARGPVTRAIQETFFSAVRGENAKYRSWLTPVR